MGAQPKALRNYSTLSFGVKGSIQGDKNLRVRQWQCPRVCVVEVSVRVACRPCLEFCVDGAFSAAKGTVPFSSTRALPRWPRKLGQSPSESLIAHLILARVTRASLSVLPILPPSIQTLLIPLVLTSQFGYFYATSSTTGELPRAVGRNKAIEKTFNHSGKGHGWPACTPLRARTAGLG
jgi:hypothetical protein